MFTLVNGLAHANARSFFSGEDAPRTHIHSLDHLGEAKLTDPRKEAQAQYEPTDFDLDKLKSTLKQFVRDWSEDVVFS